MSAPHDHATTLAIAIRQIIAEHIQNDGSLQSRLAEYLRDELANAARETLNEIRLTDE
jgi:hypothetical protein